MTKKIYVCLMMIILAAAFMGCEERTEKANPLDYESSIGPYWFMHEFFDQLGFSMFQDIKALPSMRFLAYTPPGYANPNQGPPYPVLYMLSPFGETEEFFFNHGLKQVADRMISDGEIKPMIIICVNGSNGYGGSFYGDSWAGGRYTEIIGDIQNEPATGTLIDYVDAVFNTISDLRFPGRGRINRGISGVGMGGYGAMRVAITYSDNFGSVSAISAPLDFDGNPDGSGGFIPLFKQIMNNFDGPYEDLDTSFTYPLRSIMFAAAASFSPHDTDYVDRVYIPYDPLSSDQIFGWHSADTLRITDSVTFFQPKGPTAPLKFHLPFDANGDPYPPIWNLWLENNIEDILADHPGALDDMAILLMSSADALTNDPVRFNFNQQTLDFARQLPPTVNDDTLEYSGYSGYLATGDRFLYDLYRDILKFHSDNFTGPE